MKISFSDEGWEDYQHWLDNHPKTLTRLNKLIEELSTAALAGHDAETRFRVLAAGADRNAALDILARLDELDRSRTS